MVATTCLLRMLETVMPFYKVEYIRVDIDRIDLLIIMP